MFEPTEDRVIVKLPPKVTETEGGIQLPDSAQERTETGEGEVVAVGPGKLVWTEGEGWQRKPMTLQIGDIVKFNKFRGDGGAYECSDGDEFKILLADDILAVKCSG